MGSNGNIDQKAIERNKDIAANVYPQPIAGSRFYSHSPSSIARSNAQSIEEAKQFTIPWNTITCIGLLAPIPFLLLDISMTYFLQPVSEVVILNKIMIGAPMLTISALFIAALRAYIVPLLNQLAINGKAIFWSGLLIALPVTQVIRQLFINGMPQGQPPSVLALAGYGLSFIASTYLIFAMATYTLYGLKKTADVRARRLVLLVISPYVAIFAFALYDTVL